MEGKFKRKLSPNERMYLAFEKSFNSFIINRVIHGKGYIDPERLQKALEKTGDMLKETRFKFHGGKWVDSGIPPKVSVMYSYEIGEDFNRFLEERWDLEREPLCRVVLVKGEQETTLIFRTHHGIMDGRGQSLWIEKVFRFLRGEEIKPQTSQVRDYDLLKAHGIKKKSDIIHLGRYAPIPFRDSYTIGTPVYKTLILDEEIKNITSRLMEIVHRESGQEESRFVVTRDLRERFIDARENTGNLSIPLYLDVREASWEKIYEKLLDKIMNAEDIIYSPWEYRTFGNLPGSLLKEGLAFIVKSRNKKFQTAATAVISNLGKIELKSYSTESFKAREVYALPVLSPLVPLFFVTSTMEEKSIITMGYYRGTYSEAKIERYLKILKDSLSSKEIKVLKGRSEKNSYDLVEKIFKDKDLNREAVISEGVSYSYGELFERAQDVACHLKGKGIGHGDRVALIMERTQDYIVALLGTMLLGAIFIPIDDGYPEERIGYIVKHANANLVIHTLPEQLPRHEEDIQGFDGYSRQDILYMIYTSGSTGNPKGVEITYGTFCNYVESCIRNYNIDQDTIFGFFTSISFDLSMTAIFTSLYTGGTLEMFRERITPVSLADIFKRSSMNSVKMTPTHLEILNSLLDKKPMDLILVGGEQLKVSTASIAQERYGRSCRIINEYGPTEATVGCTYHIFDRNERYLTESVPIGLPLDNVEILLEADKKTGIGEILVGGDCLAKGYAGNLEETEKKFVYMEEQRFYRTGDLAKINSGGELEFLEREDFQVKIRGYRIELEEIEKATERTPLVDIARVIPNGSKTGLLCYYMGQASESDIREHLVNDLPEYMIPYRFIKVVDLPLTNSGKLDLKKLRDLDGEKEERAPIYADLNEIEIQILELWEKILEFKIPKDRIYENFYSLGADSLSMVRLLSELKERIPTENISYVIENPTIKNIYANMKK